MTSHHDPAISLSHYSKEDSPTLQDIGPPTPSNARGSPDTSLDDCVLSNLVMVKPLEEGQPIHGCWTEDPKVPSEAPVICEMEFRK